MPICFAGRGGATTMTAGIIAAAAAIRQRDQILTALRLADATAPERARSLAEIGLAPGSAVTQLIDARVIVEARPQRWYLDERALVAYDGSARSRVMVAGALAALLALAGLGAALYAAGRPR